MNLRTCLVAALFCIAAADASAQVKTLVFCADKSPDKLNPQLSYRQSTFDATSRQLYDRLLEYAPDTAEIVPSLAESWKVSEDGLRYEFRLRADVQFHRSSAFTPSRSLNADDVAFSFARQLDPKHPYHGVSGGVYPYFRGLGLAAIIESVSAQDARTVEFRLKTPYPVFPSILTLDFASILSAEYAEAMLAANTPERVDTAPIGTGPFRLIQYETDALIRYAAHVGYWRGKAALDNLVFSIVPDATVRYQKLRDGECHVIADPDPADIPAMALDAGVKLARQVRMDIGYLAFNTRRPPLDDPRVRRALALAVDRRAIQTAIYQELGQPATTMIPFAAGSGGTAVVPPPPDIPGARRLLEEAGVSGLELEIWPSPVSRPYMPNARRMAEMIGRDWGKIGVTTRPVSVSGRDFIKKTMVGRHDVALFGWIAETMDRGMFLAPILGCEASNSGGNRSFWCNAQFDLLLQEAAKAGSPAERETLYELALSVLDREMPVLPIASSISITPVRKEVTGYRPHPLGGHYFFGVDLK